MSTRSVFALFLIAIAATPFTRAQETVSKRSPEVKTYQQFLSRPDVVVLTRKYPLGKFGYESVPNEVSANVAWELGKSEKQFAVSIQGAFVDFKDISAMIDGIDKMLQAINTDFNKSDATTATFISPTGLSLNYYEYPDGSGGRRRNLILDMNETRSFQSPTPEYLVQLRDLLSKARIKLVSLGAK